MEARGNFHGSLKLLVDAYKYSAAMEASTTSVQVSATSVETSTTTSIEASAIPVEASIYFHEMYRLLLLYTLRIPGRGMRKKKNRSCVMRSQNSYFVFCKLDVTIPSRVLCRCTRRTLLL